MNLLYAYNAIPSLRNFFKSLLNKLKYDTHYSWCNRVYRWH